MKIAVIKEGKEPPDSRVPLTPEQCRALRDARSLDLVVESSQGRCYTDAEYEALGVPVVDDISDCDLLLGVKEVPIDSLIPEKTYFFFSHTIKKQPYNRGLLRAILKHRIRLIDYEVLTDVEGNRLIAFGRFAGMVGAHNAIWTFGQRTGQVALPRMVECHDYTAAKLVYDATDFPPCKVVLTGTGRVAAGAAEVLDDMGFHKLPPAVLRDVMTDRPVYAQLAVCDYARRSDGGSCSELDFYARPERYESAFLPYAHTADIMINGIFWDPRAPAFFTIEDMRSPAFKLQVIADVTCDIAPESSIPSTIRPSSIAEPVYGFDPNTGTEVEPHASHAVDVMAIDNLPNELPRDASEAFGEQFIERVLGELFKEKSEVLQRATIAQDGQLGRHFQYLADYVSGQ